MSCKQYTARLHASHAGPTSPDAMTKNTKHKPHEPPFRLLDFEVVKLIGSSLLIIHAVTEAGYSHPLLLPFAVVGAFLNPKSSPTAPPGLGTGHCLFALALISSSSIPLNSTMFPSAVSVISGLLLLRRLPSGISPSANLTRGAGHGSMCGKATTKKLAKTVMPKSDEVMRDRGCRCGGGMVESEQRDAFSDLWAA